MSKTKKRPDEIPHISLRTAILLIKGEFFYFLGIFKLIYIYIYLFVYICLTVYIYLLYIYICLTVIYFYFFNLQLSNPVENVTDVELSIYTDACVVYQIYKKIIQFKVQPRV